MDSPLIEIDESLLVRLAGVRAFARGLHCFEEGCVRDVVTTDKTTNAVVLDGRQYTVRLRHTHRMMEGECDCDISDGIEFCQHCVAVALHLQERQTPAKPVDKRSAVRKIRRYLSTLTQEELLDELLETIMRDRALRGNLLQKARLSSEALSYSELKTMIDDVGAEDYLYESREIRAYFRGLESMLARLTERSDKLDPLVALRGVEHAIRRLNVDLDLIDYAGDFPELSMDMLIDLHRAAVNRLEWTPSELASYLVDRSLTENWHPFQWDVDCYVGQLGKSFTEALSDEIESRLSGLEESTSAGTTVPESTRDVLAELRTNLELAAGKGD